MDSYTEHDILPSVQALVIYMIMALIDQYDGTAARGVRMIQTFQVRDTGERYQMPGEMLMNTRQ